VSRHSHTYLITAVSGTAVIVVAIVGFVLLVSFQALHEHGVPGLGLPDDSGASSARESSEAASAGKLAGRELDRVPVVASSVAARGTAGGAIRAAGGGRRGAAGSGGVTAGPVASSLHSPAPAKHVVSSPEPDPHSSAGAAPPTSSVASPAQGDAGSGFPARGARGEGGGAKGTAARSPESADTVPPGLAPHAHQPSPIGSAPAAGATTAGGGRGTTGQRGKGNGGEAGGAPLPSQSRVAHRP
jgi:hypothetical protein